MKDRVVCGWSSGSPTRSVAATDKVLPLVEEKTVERRFTQFRWNCPMEVSKFKSQLFIAFGQVTAPRRRVQSIPAEQKRSISGTFQSLQKALRLAEGGPQKAV